MLIFRLTGRVLACALLASVMSVATVATTSDLSAQTRTKTKRVTAGKLKGILKKPGQRSAKKKRVRINLKRRGPGAGYAPRKRKVRVRKVRKATHTKKLMNRRGHVARSARKVRRVKSARRGSQAAKNAARARRLRNTAKAAKLARGAKYLAAGTGVGAVVGVAAAAAGVDPTELAALKATNPAEYRRRMQALKKNPVKYMGKNVKNNVGKVGRGLKRGGRKIGKGVKKIFAKRKKKRRN